jgi:hypothetical protein
MLTSNAAYTQLLDMGGFRNEIAIKLVCRLQSSLLNGTSASEPKTVIYIDRLAIVQFLSYRPTIPMQYHGE